MKKIEELEIENPGNHHCHLRTGKMLSNVSLFSRLFSGIVAMPNLAEPISESTGYDTYYNREVALHHSETLVVGGIMLTPKTTGEIVVNAYKSGARFIKNIPYGISTNGCGIWLPYHSTNVYEAASQLGMPVLLHVQKKRDENLSDQEFQEFFAFLMWLHAGFPKLKVSIEHANTSKLLYMIDSLFWLKASLAPHYTCYHSSDPPTRMKPTIYCQPPYGFLQDMYSVIMHMLYGSYSQFRYGDDSAPHLMTTKRGGNPTAGVFTYPTGIQMITSIFEKSNKLHLLKHFLRFDENFFGVQLKPEEKKKIILVKKPWEVPEEYEDIPIFKGGEMLDWQIA